MSDHDAFAERGRALEEEYFHRKETELVEKLRRAAKADATRLDMIARTGLQDPEMLREVEALGFGPDTVALLPVLPVIEVAWASGGVTDAERTLVIQLARSRGIIEGSVADANLVAWLTHRPSAEIFTRGRQLVRAMLTARGQTEGALSADELVNYCEAVASASGGFLGLHRISNDERALLMTIAADLKKQGS